MAVSLIRSRTLIAHAEGRHGCREIAEGAVLQEDGVIVAVDRFETLQARYRDVAVVGSGREILVPGFVNAHHHVGLTPLQLGSPDMPLELWFITRLVCRSIDPYLDTLYSAFEMIASGITTVQHIHGWAPGNAGEVEAISRAVLRAYHDVGMRASYCHAVREQNRLVYQDDQALVASLPAELRGPMQAWFDRFRMSLDDMIGLFERLHADHAGSRRARIQLAPANLHWCSDEALTRLSDAARAHDVKLHMHLLETAYQKEYARRRTGGSAIEHLERFDLLGPRMTLGHGVWLSESEIETVARTGTCICHNCSSNFRLRSGIAPLNRFEAAGITCAIGIDEAGINDDRDMLQEMRMVLRAHRVPGMDDSVPTVPQVFRMATVGGAATTGFAGQIGEIAVGKAADLVLLDWDQISFPYLDEETTVLDAVVQRAKAGAVTTVLCDGEAIYAERRFTRVDRDGALQELHRQLQHALSSDEVERRHLSRALLPHVRAFYRDYIDPARHEPFYRQSSRF
ncbi:MAG TPA: amidohydrolase family protein [Stellaceae bacterium]|nr:amidohydrolase family protein [Stellaceae bacterium]